MHLRRNTKLNIYNAVFAGWPTGLFIDGTASQANATANDLKVRNTYLAGSRDFFAADFDSSFFVTADFGNVKLAENSELEITDPFNLETPDFLPENGSPLLTASSWYEDVSSALSDLEDDTELAVLIYPNPFTETAKINIRLESESMLSVKVFDITGTLISTLHNDKRQAGEHELTVRVAQKGIYFAEITVDEKRQVLKLVAR
jgi:hypothetical protein